MNDIMTSLQAPRPSRASIRSKQLGIDQSPNKLGLLPPPEVAAQQAVQQGQVAVNFAHSATHLVIVIQNHIGQTVIPMTGEQWEAFKATGDTELAAIPAAEPEPEPAPVYDDDEAVLIRQRIEECVESYGKFYATPDLLRTAFRHSKHMANWVNCERRKHALTVEATPGLDGATFYPAASPLVLPEVLSAGTVHVGPSVISTENQP